MINHGWMTDKDAETIQKTLDLVCEQFPAGVINTTELGVREGKTSRGIHDYLTGKKRINFHTGVDNQHDIPVPVPFEGCNLIIGNSIEVYNQIADNSQQFLFVDACHSYPMVVADFFCYHKKVKKGGYIAFHDTGKHIKPFTDHQGMGSKEDPDMSISVRKALDRIGLLEQDKPDDDDFRRGWRPEEGSPPIYKIKHGFKLIYDEADETLHTGGVTVFKKVR